MELRVGVILYSKLGNENSDAGHMKCSRGPQVPHPWSKMSVGSLRYGHTARCDYFWVGLTQNGHAVEWKGNFSMQLELSGRFRMECKKSSILAYFYVR